MRLFVQECEESFEKRFESAVKDMAFGKNMRVIALCGPTCSGKTTAASRIIEKMRAHGKRVNVVSIDDFYYDKEELHRMSSDENNGEIDYDSVKTIDMPTLSDFVEKIFCERELFCPVFDFKVGRRVAHRRIESTEDDVFLFEGIQAIYPEVTSLFDTHGYDSVYIAPQSTLCVGEARFEPNELRLLRRIVRDRIFRGTSAEFTFKIWKSVRDNEEKHIFPYTDRCQLHIDSSFGYEMGILRPYLLSALAEVSHDSEYRDTADNIIRKISFIQDIPSELLAENSLYREFV